MAFVSRIDFQSMAQAKFDDASLLLKNGRHSNAFYLAGYAIELGLKAAICRQILAECLPDRKLIEDVYRQGHKLQVLVGLAGLTEELNKAEANAVFQAHWSIVSQWSESARYEMIDAVKALELVTAIGDAKDGVLRWLKQHW
ncbi:MAG: DNA-binding protein [Hyphomonadaceae bacterium]